MLFCDVVGCADIAIIVGIIVYFVVIAWLAVVVYVGVCCC